MEFQKNLNRKVKLLLHIFVFFASDKGKVKECYVKCSDVGLTYPIFAYILNYYLALILSDTDVNDFYVILDLWLNI